ncbi:MAG: hypothetical protein ACHQAY_19790 [Hyphomicrobiales bacterium]
MLIDIAAAVAVVLASAAILYLGLGYDVAIAGLALLIFGFILSELMAGRQGFRLTGFVLALVAAIACFVLGQLAVVSIAAFDRAPDLTRQFFAPLTAGAVCASIGALAHRARYHAPFSLVIALPAALYALFGALKLTLGQAWLRL